jgi:hypothetical protein
MAVTITTDNSAIAVLTEALKEIQNSQTVLASETADDNAKTAALAAANTALTNANAEITQILAEATALNAGLANPVTTT